MGRKPLAAVLMGSWGQPGGQGTQVTHLITSTVRSACLARCGGGGRREVGMFGEMCPGVLLVQSGIYGILSTRRRKRGGFASLIRSLSRAACLQ